MEKNSLGATIRKLRRNIGMQQQELARVSLMSKSFLSEIETGRKDPNLSRLMHIASALDIPVSVIVFLTIQNEDLPEPKKLAWESSRQALIDFIAEIFPEIKYLQ